MEKVYMEEPVNFLDISRFVITDIQAALKEVVMAKKCFFYDTCSFRKHMTLLNTDGLLQYIKESKGIVIVTRCIIMELCSKDNRLWKEHIAYFEKLYNANIPVLVIYEEDIFNIMFSCYSGISKINDFLTYAVRKATSKVGTVMETLENDAKLRQEVVSDKKVLDSTLYSSFFKKVRRHKRTGDNLGEELIAICMHILSNLPELDEFKYIILTEDKGAITLIHKAARNIYDKTNRNCISAFTTSKLVQILYDENFIDKDQVEYILKNGETDDLISVKCAEMYDLEPLLKTMSIESLADKIVSNCGIKVFL